MGLTDYTVGFIIRIIGTNVWKNKGTTRFMSGITETSALDERVKEITYLTDIEKEVTYPEIYSDIEDTGKK